MKLRSLIIATLSLSLLFSVVTNAAAQDPSGDLAVIHAAADKYLSSGKAPVISADALWENMNDGDPANDPFILSVRSPEDYAKGHIPGAINIPWKEVAKSDNLSKLPTDQQIVVYCYTGHTGQIASTVLNMLGYDATNLKFGMMGWTEDDTVLGLARFGPTTDQRDYRVEQEAHEATGSYAFPELNLGVEGDFEIVRAAADRWLSDPAAPPIVSADSVWENMNDGDPANDPLILSVRSPEDYAKGHVPGAINIPWKEVAKSDNLAKLSPDQNINAYCYTGHTGQVATTVLGIMGYKVSNMKYGMMGWTEDDDVLATQRFSPDVQRDYRLETEMAAAEPTVEQPAASEPTAEQPPALPATGAPATPWWLAWSVAGLASLGAGVALRRRSVH